MQIEIVFAEKNTTVYYQYYVHCSRSTSGSYDSAHIQRHKPATDTNHLYKQNMTRYLWNFEYILTPLHTLWTVSIPIPMILSKVFQGSMKSFPRIFKTSLEGLKKFFEGSVEGSGVILPQIEGGFVLKFFLSFRLYVCHLPS